jgi:carbon monoxide dehydrogenase subunit G
MQLENEFAVPVPVSQTWSTLLDVQRIAPCMPGATVERVDGDEVAGRVRVKVGPIALSYAGRARFITKDEAEHRIVLEASGRETKGSGTAAAKVETQMIDEGSATRVKVLTDLDVTGKPAQFGRGVMADVAGKLTDQFAACLAKQVQAPDGADAASGGGAGTRGAPGQASQAAEVPGASASQAAGQGTVTALPGATAAEQPDSLDLIGTVAMPLVKRFAPTLAGLLAGLVIGALAGRRQRVIVVTVPAPRRGVQRSATTM